MPKTVPIQDKFAAGEITPRFLGQPSHEAYKAGVQEAYNMVAVSQGPMRRRSGATYHGSVDGTYGRLWGFPIASHLGAWVVVTDEQEMHIATTAGFVTDGNRVTNGNFVQGDDNWTQLAPDVGYIVVHRGALDLVPGPVSVSQDRYAGVRQTVTLATGAVDHRLRVQCLHEFEMAELRIRVGTTLGGSQLYSQTLRTDVPSVETTFDPQGNTTIYVDVYALENDDGLKRHLTDVIIENPATSSRINFSTPWSLSELSDIQVAMPPGENKMYFFNSVNAPQVLDYDVATETWTFGAVSFTGAPAAWAAGNYPGSVCFFQGRMWVGGTPNEPEQFWGSISADYTNFTLGSNPADALSFYMAHKGAIQWMVGAKNLLIGTEFGEHIVTAESGIITPGDIAVDQQSAYGSAHVQPVQIGNQILYVSPDRRKVRDMGYKWTDDGWVSRDITYASEHITFGRLISDIVFSQNPDNQILCACQDGSSVAATYERANNVVGWFQVETAGYLLAFGDLELHGNSTVAALVKRDIESTPQIYFEIVDPVAVTDSELQFQAPSGQMLSDFTASHLKNQTVNVIADGALHPDVTLDATGYGQLQWEAEEVHVGLPFTARMETLPLASTLQIGQSTLPLKKRYNKIFVRIIDSAIPKINDVRPPTRQPATPMDTREPNVYADIQVTNLGWSQYARITVEQDLPLGCTVGSIFGEAAQEIIGGVG